MSFTRFGTLFPYGGRQPASCSRRLVVCVTALLLFICATEAALCQDGLIERGIDLFSTPPRESSSITALADAATSRAPGLTFVDFSGNPIPNGFFAEGSEAFTGRIDLKGFDLEEFVNGPVDTVVERLEDAQLSACGSSAKVPIQIRALQLVNINPIPVSFPDAEVQEWDVLVTLSSESPQSVGSMTIRRGCAQGGTIKSWLPVIPKFVFARQGVQLVLDPGPEVVFDGEGRWVFADTLREGLHVLQAEPGIAVDSDRDGQLDLELPGTTNFVAGVGQYLCSCEADEGSAPRQTGGLLEAKKRLLREQAQRAAHMPAVAQTQHPDDEDGDFIFDDCDNCPPEMDQVDPFASSNPGQEDADGDSVGDLCDNCPQHFNPNQEDADDDKIGDICEPALWLAQFGHGQAFGNQFSSQINMLNLASTPDQVDIRTFSDDGTPIPLLDGGSGPVDQLERLLAGFGAASVDSANADPNDLTLGWARVGDADSVQAEAIFEIRSVQSGSLDTAAAVPARPLTSAASFIGHVGDGVNTGVALLNPIRNTHPTNVILVLLDESGEKVAEVVVTLDAGQKLARFLTELLPGLQDFWGTVEVRSDLPIALLPLRQQGVVLTTLQVFPPRKIQH